MLRHFGSAAHSLEWAGAVWERYYTLVPHKLVTEAVGTFLERHYRECGSQNEFLVDLLIFALDNNFFQFFSRFYHQTKSTSMGAPWAPAYACLHLGLWEEDLVFTSPMNLGHVHTWLRYIDDVLMIWRGDVESLK